MLTAVVAVAGVVLDVLDAAVAPLAAPTAVVAAPPCVPMACCRDCSRLLISPCPAPTGNCPTLLLELAVLELELVVPPP